MLPDFSTEEEEFLIEIAKAFENWEDFFERSEANIFRQFISIMNNYNQVGHDFYDRYLTATFPEVDAEENENMDAAERLWEAILEQASDEDINALEQAFEDGAEVRTQISEDPDDDGFVGIRIDWDSWRPQYNGQWITQIPRNRAPATLDDQEARDIEEAGRTVRNRLADSVIYNYQRTYDFFSETEINEDTPDMMKAIHFFKMGTGSEHEFGDWRCVRTSNRLYVLTWQNLPVAMYARNGQTVLLMPDDQDGTLDELWGVKGSFVYSEVIPGHCLAQCKLPETCNHVLMIRSVGLPREILRTLAEMIAEDGEEW